MNKQSVAKLKLFASGIISRYEENKDIFIGLKGEYTSGLKAYPFSINDSELFLNNEKASAEFPVLIDKIIDSANLYDSIKITYMDRTGTLIISGDNRNITVKTDNKIEKPEETKKSNFISPKKAAKLLEALDFVTKDGKLKNSHTRKYAQAEHFIELLIPYIEKLPKEKEIYIYDLACGKSYLSFFLNYFITDILKRRCRIIGLDINETVIKGSNEIKDKLKYHNMEFFEANILEYEPKTPMDIAVSLHACDVATDYAIAAAVNSGAKILAIAPCCHKEFLPTIDNASLDCIFKYGIMKKRFSDILTDIYRAETLANNGYDIKLLEFVSPIETPKNLLILGEKTGNKKETDIENIEKDFNVNPILNKLIF